MVDTNNNGRASESDIFRAINEIRAITPKVKEQYFSDRKKGINYGLCLINAGYSLGEIKTAEKRALEIRAKKNAGIHTKTGTKPVQAVNYNGFRGMVNNMFKGTKAKIAAIGLAGLLGAGGIYIGVRGSSGPSQSDIHRIIYNGIDESNWASESNRQQHPKNIEARLSAIKDCKDLGDSDGARQSERQLNEYISTVESKDPSYAPILKQKMEELKVKYKL